MFKIIQGGKRNINSIPKKSTEPVSERDFINEYDAFMELAYEYAYADSDTDTDNQRILFKLIRQGNKFIELFDNRNSFSNEALALKGYIEDYVKDIQITIPYLKMVQ